MSVATCPVVFCSTAPEESYGGEINSVSSPFPPRDWSSAHFSPHIPRWRYLYIWFCGDWTVLPTAWTVLPGQLDPLPSLHQDLHHLMYDIDRQHYTIIKWLMLSSIFDLIMLCNVLWTIKTLKPNEPKPKPVVSCFEVLGAFNKLDRGFLKCFEFSYIGFVFCVWFGLE